MSQHNCIRLHTEVKYTEMLTNTNQMSQLECNNHKQLFSKLKNSNETWYKKYKPIKIFSHDCIFMIDNYLFKITSVLIEETRRHYFFYEK